MTIDPRFIACADLQQYFVDKDTGFPLDAGEVTFYSDVNRTIKKPVYMITGSPPSYSFSVLPNPMILSSVGTFEYNGNDIIPYYFPYEGTPDDSNGTVELYYVTVTSKTPFLVPQFTREAWPPNVNNGGDPISDAGYRNLIPNGQFWTHTDIVGTSQPPVISLAGVDTQYIAQGGWTFSRTTGGASTFNNSFELINGAIPSLNDYPRYAFNYRCTSFDPSDQVRDIGIEWPDVNKFTTGSPPGTQPYTFFFGGKSLDANTYTFDVRMIRYYGTGGSPSPTTDTSIGSVIISPTETYITVLINGFPYDGGTIGTNNDDFVRVALRGPESSAAIQVTDFVQAPGNLAITAFPLQTTADILARSIAGWVTPPNPDGSDLYLQPILTPKGMVWQHSEVGQIKSTTDIKNFTGSLCDTDSLMICDGNAYPYNGYSPLGVPYYRLGDVLWDDVNLVPRTGTGIDYAMGFIPSSHTNFIRLVTNAAGAQTATADGTSPTSFTFSTLYTGSVSYQQNAFVTQLGNQVFVYDIAKGSTTAATAGTSGFVISYNEVDGVAQPSNPSTNNFFYITINALPGVGTYFTFSNTVPANFYVWFTIDGIGSDPAPGGTGILVPLLSTYSTATAAQMIREAVSGYQGSLIVTVPGASVSAGSYFTFHANGDDYVVWYKVGGIGAAPVVSGTLIPVELTGVETDAEVATLTVTAINKLQYAVPNLKGAILRGQDVGANNIPGDLSASLRFNIPSQPAITNIMTYQWSQVLDHVHAYNEPPSVTTFNPTPSPEGDDAYVRGDSFLEFSSLPLIEPVPTYTGRYGAPETTPFNFSVNFIIKY